MTHLEALTALRDKVKRSVDTAHDHAAAFPSESAGGHCTWHDSHKASNGSLDAAKALHKAALPEWIVHDFSQNSRSMGWTMILASMGGDYTTSHQSDNVGFLGDPARAWLLATLEALIQMERN